MCVRIRFVERQAGADDDRSTGEESVIALSGGNSSEGLHSVGLTEPKRLRVRHTAQVGRELVDALGAERIHSVARE